MSSEYTIELVISRFRDHLYGWSKEIMREAARASKYRGVSTKYTMYGVLGGFRRDLGRGEKRVQSILQFAGLGNGGITNWSSTEPQNVEDKDRALEASRDVFEWFNRTAVKDLKKAYVKILSDSVESWEGGRSNAISQLDDEVLEYLRSEGWITGRVDMYNLIGRIFRTV